MKKSFARAYVKTITDTGLITGVTGSTAAVDRYGEIIDQESWDLKHYKKNPVILWAHNLTFGEDRPPIGKAAKVAVKDGSLMFDIQFDMSDPFAADIFRKYKEGFLNAFSVGFIPHRIERVDDEKQPALRAILKDNELLELSAVPVPANPEALQSLRARSFKTKTWDKMVEEVEAESADKDEDKDADKAVDEDAIVDKVVAKITPTITQTISDVVSKAIPKSPSENGGGAAPDSAPVKTQQGAEKLVALIRETTKSFQSVLAEVNAANRGK